jgi:hypothetical protein
VSIRGAGQRERGFHGLPVEAAGFGVVMRGAGWQIAHCYGKPLEQPFSQRPRLSVERLQVESPFRHGFNRLADPLPHPHRGCVTIPLDIPDDSSPGMGGNGMDKGDFRSSPCNGNLGEDSPFFRPPAAAVTTHAAAKAEASADFGGCAPTAKRDHGSPPYRLSLRWVFETCEPCKVGGAVQRVWFCWATRLNTPILQKLLRPDKHFLLASGSGFALVVGCG